MNNPPSLRRRAALACALLLSLAAAIAIAAPAGDPPALDSHLEPFRAMLGKTWKGAFKDSTPDRPVVDVQRWERALNGRAIRVLHSVNQGAYGGETLFVWDAKQNALTYHYFTTAGFTTIGKVTVQEGKIITHEDVNGDPGGVTEVRATSEILPGGKFHVRAEYGKKGQWSPGHEVTYEEDPAATVVFK